MKKGIIGILNNPATSNNSHSAGMVNIVSKLLTADVLTQHDDWDTYDELIVYHGTNFKKGVYNVIGGISDDVLNRCNKLQNYSKSVKSLDGFQLNDFSIKRKINLYNDHNDFEEINLPSKQKVLIGDSHSISVWPDESYSINRIDGKTLHGFLNNPTIADYYYFGNIDIRFHLPRQSDPVMATRELVERYISYAKINNARVSCLLPVESENRKIPSTGLYKGRKFFGSRELRVSLVDIFNNQLLNSGLDVNVWPKRWYDDIEFYENEVMEPRQSVHIRPKFYAKNISL
jgi:hypothetical protein